MNTATNKPSANKTQADANGLPKMQSSGEANFFDNAKNETQPKEKTIEVEQRLVKPIQEKTNNIGLPNNLKAGVENLSGYSMDDVKVHYNSAQPAQLNAHAYAQGQDIHIAPGQEKHLPHEAWHVVQQMEGSVKPTMQMKAGVPVNDDAALEKEADIMGAKALDL